MKPLFISGIGVISARGRGIEKFEAALKQGWIAPSLSQAGRPAYRISNDDLSDSDVLKTAKRADRFSKATLLAAYDAVKDSGAALKDIQESTGAIVATALGSHSTIFKFLDGILDYGEKSVSPTTFAHSIHNAATSYLTSALGCKGPAITVTDFYFPFQHALMLAYAWLNEERFRHVLVGVSDECSSAMDYIFEEKFQIASDGKMNPHAFSENPKTVPGEGSAFFLLSLNPAEKKYGAFSAVETSQAFKGWSEADISVVGTNGMGGSEKMYEQFSGKGKSVAAFSDIYGGMMASSAFDCAAAALILKKQRSYGVSDIDIKKSEKAVNTVQCISHNNLGELVFVKLIK